MGTMNLSTIDEQLMLDVLSVPTVSQHEHLLVEFLMDFAKKHDVDASLDDKGNVYFTKGMVADGEFFPCVCAHMDTVQDEQLKWINENKRLEIKIEEYLGRHYLSCEGFGLGGDDKAGVLICLTLLKRLPVLKAVFFVEEEMGCLGSEKAELGWFKDVGYVLAFDSPGQDCSWACGGARLFDRQFYENYLVELEQKFTIEKWCNHPFTDIMFLRQDTSLACMNIGAGYYKYHTNLEYCVAEHMDEAAQMGLYLIDKLGNNEYLIPYTSRMCDTNNEDDKYFFEKFGTGW